MNSLECLENTEQNKGYEKTSKQNRTRQKRLEVLVKYLFMDFRHCDVKDCCIAFLIINFEIPRHKYRNITYFQHSSVNLRLTSDMPYDRMPVITAA